MKNLIYLSAIILTLLCTSCSVAIQRHGFLHDRDLEITLEDERGETELLSVSHENNLFGSNFYFSIPFIRINVAEDNWNNERYVDIDLFR